MFKNAVFYRIAHWERPSHADIEDRLAALRFVECGNSQAESVGWAEPRGEKHGALMENVGGQLLLKLSMERKAVPSSVIKGQLDEQLDKIEQETGRRPRGKQTKEIKEQIIHALLPRAFPKRSSTFVWIDPKAKLVVLDSTGTKRADGIMTLLTEALGGGIRLALVQTQLSPCTGMSAWLRDKQAPAGFTVDRECELRQPDSDKSTVKYARHTLEIDEVAEHIKQGKLPTQLALSWQGRVSFVLTEALALKRIKMLDVVLEGTGVASGAAREDSGFDADVAIVTGELSGLIPELIEALDGELVADGAPLTSGPMAAQTPAPAPARVQGPELAPWDA